MPTIGSPHGHGPAHDALAHQHRRADLLVHLLAGRWALAVLAELEKSGRRYQDLHDALDGISYKVLTETLRRAERDGLISRRPAEPDPVEAMTQSLEGARARTRETNLRDGRTRSPVVWTRSQFRRVR